MFRVRVRLRVRFRFKIRFVVGVRFRVSFKVLKFKDLKHYINKGLKLLGVSSRGFKNLCVTA